MPPAQGTSVFEVPSDYGTTKQVHSDTYAAIQSANLKGKSVFITGASSKIGLGRALAVSFAKAGASHIAGTGRKIGPDFKEEILAAAKSAGHSPPEVLTLKFDVLDEQAIKDAAAEIQSKWGSLDVLINNAGISGDSSKIGDTTTEQWWSIFEIDFKGPYLMTREFLPLLLQGAKKGQNEKFIINVGSLAQILSWPGRSAYQGAKLALWKFTSDMQVEYGEQGVTSVAIHPGAVMTEIMNTGQVWPQEVVDAFVDTPQLSGDTVAYLVANKGTFMGGRFLNCVWDLPELFERKEEILKKNLLTMQLAFA